MYLDLLPDLLKEKKITMIELKSCPFCGGEARLFVNDGVRVLCTKCRASSKILVDSECYKTSAVEKAIEAWNRRTEVKQ